MSSSGTPVHVRPMNILDLKHIFAIDQAVRASGVSKTYEGYTTQMMFNMDEKEPSKKADILEVAKLTDMGLVAEHEGEVCGFVLGRISYLAEFNINEGEIAIIGVHPEKQGNGIANMLMESIQDLLKKRGAKRVRIGLDPEDQQMQGFLKKMGYDGQQMVYFQKVL